MVQRIDFVVTADDVFDRSEGIVFAEGRVGAGDGELADRRAVMHIAEVDEADGAVAANNDVVIVRVAMNDAVANGFKHRPSNS